MTASLAEDREAARRALACLDLTDLSDSCEERDVERLCARATTPWGNVAAVCVWPRFVAEAKRMLDISRVHVATVVNFPHGREDAGPPVAETKQALADGADEIDVVMPWRAVLDRREDEAAAVLRAVKSAAGSRPLKVILESGEIADTGRVRAAADLAIASGADFLKTSTGKTRSGATPEAVGAMLDAIAVASHPVGLKVSGGVRTLDDARAYMDLAERRMGPGWATPANFRIGASGLLDALVAALEPDRRGEDDAPESEGGETGGGEGY